MKIKISRLGHGTPCLSNQTSDRLDLKAEALAEARRNIARFDFPSRRVRRSVMFTAAKNHFVAVREAQYAQQEIISKRDAEAVDSQGLAASASQS